MPPRPWRSRTTTRPAPRSPRPGIARSTELHRSTPGGGLSPPTRSSRMGAWVPIRPTGPASSTLPLRVARRLSAREPPLQNAVRADTGDVEHLGHDRPPLPFPELESCDPRVAPEQLGAAAVPEGSQRVSEQRPTDAPAHEVAARRHAAHLPRILTATSATHAGDTGHRLSARAQEGAEVTGLRLVVAVEPCGFQPEPGPELGVSQREDLVDGGATELEVVRDHGTTASASISTSAAASMSADTWTMEVAGRMAPKTSPCARPTSPAAAMSVTNMRVRTTCSRRPPSASMAAPMIASARRACSPAVGG